MKGIPVVKSKLTMPQLLDSVIITERTKKLINSMSNKKSVIITAPSGYGKTTLMIASLHHLKGKNCRVCWYRLEQEDEDLSVFYAYFIESLFPKEDSQWEEARQLIGNFADYQSQYRYINAVICQELWAYFNKHPEMVTLIAFDDLHNAKDSLEISETLTYLIRNLPNNCMVVLSSRQQLDILTEKHKLEFNTLEINRDDLCFREKEIAELLDKIYQTNASEKLMEKIKNSTEGWIAGIIMVCRMLFDSNPADKSYLPEKTWQKSKLFSYMASEVLKAIDPMMLQFLVKASVLHDFTIKEAEQILKIDNAAALVYQCEKKGLFIQKIIRDNIIYRFHNLFRDTLLHLQQDLMSDEEIKDLNLQAAAYYIERKIFARAIEHFIVCNDINSAVDLITRESVTLITFEAIDQLKVWFKLLPNEVVEQNPSLLYIKSFTYQQGKDHQMIPLMEKALAKFKEKNDLIMQVYSLMTLIHYYIFTNNIKKLLDSISHALSLLKCIDNKKLKFMKHVLWFIRSVFNEKFSSAIIFSKRLLYCEMDDDWKWVVQLHSCMLGYLTGELDYAESAINDAFKNNLAKKGEFFKALALTYYCTVLHLKNDTTALMAEESRLMAIGEKHEYNFMLGFGKRASGYRKYAMHDLESAVEHLEVSSQHFEQFGNLVMSTLNKLCVLLWRSRHIETEMLLIESRKVYNTLSSVHPGFCLFEISQSILGAIARECGEYKLAEEYLLNSIKASERKGAKQILCGSYLHLAKLYFDIEENEKADYYLKKGFTLASNGKYYMFWDIHLPTLTEISLRAIKSNILTEYPRKMMERLFKQEGALYIEKNIHRIDYTSIKDFSDTILLKFGVIDNADFSYRIDICLFENFVITINGTPIKEDEWKTKKIKGILKYLVLHRGKAVAREVLTEIFWPNSDKKSAAASLRVALYEMKKILSKNGIKNDSDTPFIYEKSDSLQIKPNKMLSIDADIFIALYDEYKCQCQLKQSRDKKQQLRILERMNSIYTGDLLGEDIYTDWILADREMYKSMFLETVITLASLYIEENEFNKAEKTLLKVLTLDPYNEEACLILLKLYVSENKRSLAVRLYLDFEKRLNKDLNITPDKSMTSIFKQLTVNST